MNTGSLRKKITLLSLLPCLVLGLLLTCFLVANQIIDHQEFNQQRGKRASHQLAVLAAPAIAQQQTSYLQTLSRTFLQEPGINGVAIYDAKFKLLVQSGQLDAEQEISALLQAQAQQSYTSSTSLFTQPVRTNSLVGSTTEQAPQATQILAWVVIEFEQQNLLKKLYRNLILAALIILLSLLVSGVYSLRQHRLWQNGLRIINEGLARIRLGDMDYQIKIDKDSEFKNLIYEVNNMTSSLRLAFGELQNSVESGDSDLRETLETIEVQNIELDIARKEAIEASRVKSEFLANTSHEIRTPLNGIMGFSRQLEKSDLNHQQREYLSIINQSSKSLLHIINDILDFSKIEAGKLVLDHVEFNLRSIIDEVSALLAPSAHEKELDLVQLIHPQVPALIVGDPLRLKQVLSNLISNAIKFTHQGQICIEVSLESLQQQQAQLIFRVSDTGIGLSEQQQADIFSAFTQANTSTSREFGGTGLGLVIAKRLTEQMGGDIGIQSQVSQGSSFWFTMKAQLPETLQLTKKLPANTKLAIIEAQPQHQLSLQYYCQFWQYEFQLFDQLEQFKQLSQAQQHSFNKVIYGLDNTLNTAQLRHQLNTLAQLASKNYYLINSSDDLNLLTPQQQTQALLKPCGHDKLLSLLLEQPLLTRHQHSYRFKQALPVLAVDDNAANLKLITTLLDEMGLTVTALDSGIKALDAIQKQNFAIIFMDIQMPELDGVETTAKIRKLSGAKAQTPIIAITAHALQEEKQRLLNAGLNDYITKPIDEQQLYQLIINWTEAEALTSNNIAKEPALNPQAAKTIAPLNKPVSIQRCLSLAKNKPELAHELLAMLLAELETDQADFNSLYQQQDWPQLLARVHKLHGACCYTGVENLRLACLQAESILKQNRLAELESAMEQLKHAISELLEWQQDVDIEFLFAE